MTRSWPWQWHWRYGKADATPSCATCVIRTMPREVEAGRGNGVEYSFERCWAAKLDGGRGGAGERFKRGLAWRLRRCST